MEAQEAMRSSVIPVSDRATVKPTPNPQDLAAMQAHQDAANALAMPRRQPCTRRRGAVTVPPAAGPEQPVRCAVLPRLWEMCPQFLKMCPPMCPR